MFETWLSCLLLCYCGPTSVPAPGGPLEPPLYPQLPCAAVADLVEYRLDSLRARLQRLDSLERPMPPELYKLYTRVCRVRNIWSDVAALQRLSHPTPLRWNVLRRLHKELGPTAFRTGALPDPLQFYPDDYVPDPGDK